MATEEDRLADELASLRLDRGKTGGGGGAAARGRSQDGPRRGVGSLVVALVVVALLGVGGFYVFREGSGRIFSEDVELGAVTLMSPAQQDVTLVATGYVYARKKANVAPKAAGRIAKFFVDEGSKVKEGDMIVELESEDARAQLAQVRADIAASRARVERARADLADATVRFNREKELLAKQAGTQASYDDAKARLDAARTALSSTDADVGSVQARQSAVAVALDNTKVRAPFGGTVLRKLAEVGEVI
ncbi:MAG TPA: biotin/lipoyl-binding protein, partial [Polyangia bacterium]